MEPDYLHERIAVLERSLRTAHTRLIALFVVFVAVAGAACTSLATARASADAGVLKVRGIVVTDEKGVERIHIGSPLPSPPGEGSQRVAKATGILIHDANGRERFGLGLLDNGLLAMGFDAAPGTGDDANRERLHMGVTPDGHGYIRFLDPKTALAGRLHLDEEQKLALEFWRLNQSARKLERSSIDVNGWRRLPDQPLPPRQ